MTQKKTVLGLDLGVTSVGWALITTEFEADGSKPSREITAAGVRIFPATTEDKTNAPKNHKRRTSRGQRRLVRRKAQRRNDLKKLLSENGLLPPIEPISSSKAFHDLGDPYELRVRALTDKLEPFEIGRAFYHLSKRRGFLSNRKSGDANEDGKVLGGIARIREELESGEFKTIGHLLSTKPKKRKHFTHRAMTESEFESIWAAQHSHYPELLSDDLKTRVKNTIFFQRPLRSQRGLIGKCSFEPDKKRCDLARQEAQRFRYWQDLNNLQLQDRTTLNWRPLREVEKELLVKELENTEVLKYEKLRKILKLDDDVRINLEANDKKIKGNSTAYHFRKALKKSSKPWDNFTPSQQDRLIEELFRIDNEIALSRRLSEHWNFDEEDVNKLFGVWHKLEDGYSRLSLKAIRKVLPLMMQGKRYDEAASEIYGDHRKSFGSDNTIKLALPPKDLRNPIVFKALCEVRKVVNAIIREFGRPDEIRLEMARDLKLTKLQKERAMKQANQNKRDNEEAAAFFKQKFNLENISSTDKLKYRLWKESNGQCPYTGKTIPPEALLDDGLVDIEHIIPYSKCFDDSYMNKTICDAKFNREVKRNQAPGEIYDRESQQFFELMERFKALPPPKVRKFELSKEELDRTDWAGRQLSDTRYICKEVRGYLRQLYPYSPDENKYVQVVAGGATANLRHVWHVNAILSAGDVDVKNRTDHRHHAVDAIVIALTDRGLYQYISKLAGQNRDRMKRILSGFELPWESFLGDVEAVLNSMVVSHAPTRRVRGQFVEETAYGPTVSPGVFVTKKELASMTPKMVENIVDKTIKGLVKARLELHDGDIKKAFGDETQPLLHLDGVTPIRKTRIYVTMSPETLVAIKDTDGKEYKYYPLAGNHHVQIFENLQTEERKAVLVPRFYAAQRGWKPVDLGPEWRKMFSLFGNDYIEFLEDDGQLRIYRVQKMSLGPKVTARPPNDTRKDYISGISLNIEGRGFKKIIRKLTVDPLGHLSQAND